MMLKRGWYCPWDQQIQCPAVMGHVPSDAWLWASLYLLHLLW